MENPSLVRRIPSLQGRVLLLGMGHCLRGAEESWPGRGKGARGGVGSIDLQVGILLALQRYKLVPRLSETSLELLLLAVGFFHQLH